MGPGGNCDAIKILDRMLRSSPEGLTYESDPRHVDLLASSMGLTISNAVSTPGTKEPNADYEATKTNETKFQNGFGISDGIGKQKRVETTDTVQCNAINMVKNSALTNKHGPRQTIRHVTFKEDKEEQRVQGHATIYGVHPSFIKSTRNGMVQLQKPCNPYTSKSERVMTRRRMQQMRNADIDAHTQRMRQLMKANEALRSERRQKQTLWRQLPDRNKRSPALTGHRRRKSQPGVKAPSRSSAWSSSPAHRMHSHLRRQRCIEPCQLAVISSLKIELTSV